MVFNVGFPQKKKYVQDDFVGIFCVDLKTNKSFKPFTSDFSSLESFQTVKTTKLIFVDLGNYKDLICL